MFLKPILLICLIAIIPTLGWADIYGYYAYGRLIRNTTNEAYLIAHQHKYNYYSVVLDYTAHLHELQTFKAVSNNNPSHTILSFFRDNIAGQCNAQQLIVTIRDSNINCCWNVADSIETKKKLAFAPVTGKILVRFSNGWINTINYFKQTKGKLSLHQTLEFKHIISRDTITITWKNWSKEHGTSFHYIQTDSSGNLLQYKRSSLPDFTNNETITNAFDQQQRITHSSRKSQNIRMDYENYWIYNDSFFIKPNIVCLPAAGENITNKVSVYKSIANNDTQANLLVLKMSDTLDIEYPLDKHGLPTANIFSFSFGDTAFLKITRSGYGPYYCSMTLNDSVRNGEYISKARIGFKNGKKAYQTYIRTQSVKIEKPKTKRELLQNKIQGLDIGTYENSSWIIYQWKGEKLHEMLVKSWHESSLLEFDYR